MKDLTAESSESAEEEKRREEKRERGIILRFTKGFDVAIINHDHGP